jgi:hypothetical protein
VFTVADMMDRENEIIGGLIEGNAGEDFLQKH